jgi:hypothetical protein
VLSSPLVRSTSLWTESFVLDRPYLSAPEILEVEAYAAFKPKYEALSLQDAEHTRVLGERADALRPCKFYDGQISSAGGGRAPQLVARRQDFYRWAGEKHEGLVAYFEPAALEAQLARVDRDYVRADALPPEWIEKAKHLCSSAAADALQAQGLRLVDRETFQTARFLDGSATKYISRALVHAVEGLETNPQTRPEIRPETAAEPLGPTRHFYWGSAEGGRAAMIGFGQYAGRSVQAVVEELKAAGGRRPLSYFTEYIAKRDFPPHVKEIAAKIVQLAKKAGSFPEGELRAWLESQSARWNPM